MRKIIFSFIISILFISCSPVLNTIYGVNKNRVFESKEALVDYYHNKLDLDKERLYFFDSSQQREEFMVNELAKLDNIMFYGLHINDSTKVDDTTAGDKTCIGVLNNFVLNNNMEKTLPSELHKFKVYDSQGKSLDINNKPTVVFIVDSNFGRIAKTQTNYIVKHIKEQNKSIDYVYISTDYYQQINKIVQK